MRRIAVWLGIFAATCFSLAAQTNVASGEVQGLVTDASGAPVPDVAITLTSDSTGLRRTTTTATDGGYRLLLVPPGVYTLQAMKDSFRPAERSEVNVFVGQSATIDIALQIGEIREALTVRATASLVDADRVHASSAITEARIRNLPIDRRDYLTFSLLSPGVADAKALADNTDLRVKQTPTSGLSFFGSNGRGNSVTVDGGEMNDGAGGVRSTVSQEAVREFQVNRANYSAELGTAGGGAINIVTRSGANDPHASLFWFTRHQSLDAANPFARVVTPSGITRVKPPSKRQQFGATLGVPLRRDRTFLFGSFEGLVRRESTAVSVLPDYSIFGPTPQQEAVLTQLPADTAAVLRAVLTSPPSTVELFERNSGIFPYRSDVYRSSVRLDHTAGASDYFFARIDVPHNVESNANIQALIGASRGIESRQFDPTAIAGWTRILSPRSSNDLRLQGSYRRFRMENSDPFGPELRIAGYGVFNRDVFLPSRNMERRFELRDDLQFVSGSHVVRTGGQLWLRSITSESEVFFPGRFTFGDLPGTLLNPALPPSFVVTGLQAFNLGLPQTFIIGAGSPTVSAVHPYAGFYVQDSWRVARNLTLDLGLRYEIDVRKNPLPTDANNLAPRFAFAWSPGASGRTVIRGGYGLFYTVGNFAVDYTARALNSIDGHRQIAQAFSSILVPGPASAPNIFSTLRRQGVIGVPTPTRSITPADLAQFGIAFPHDGPLPPFTVLFGNSKDYASAYTQQWSFSAERQISSDFSIEAGGLLASTLNLPRARDANLLPAPVDSALGIRVWNTNAAFVDPLLASHNVFESTARAFYWAGTLELRRRFGSRLDVGGNYTFSRAIDDVLDYNYEFEAFDQTNLRAERALSSFHQKHKFVFWGLGTLPRRFLLSGIVRASSGRPFNLLAGYDLNQDRNDQTDRPAGAGRNTGLGPSFWTLDLRLAKSFAVAEPGRIEFTAEAFNLLNSLSYSSVNNVVGNMAGPFNVEGRHDRLPTQPLGFTSAHDTRKVQLGVRATF